MCKTNKEALIKESFLNEGEIMKKNKSTMGLSRFIEELYQDCKSGIHTDWWNERFARKADGFIVSIKDRSFKNVYEVISYIKTNYDSIAEEDIKELSQKVKTTYPRLNIKRSYMWEVDDSLISPKEVTVEVSQEEASLEKSVEEKIEEKDSSVPDFEYAKTLEDKQELKKYAKSFKLSIDSRKSLSDMMKSFQGKYYASKAVVKKG